MRQLRDDTHLILDGEVRVYRRERSQVVGRQPLLLMGTPSASALVSVTFLKLKSMPARRFLSTSSVTKTICPL